MTAYDIYQYYLNLYLNGEITFNELKIYLEASGIITDNLALNEDGSVYFFGETSREPMTSDDIEDAIPDDLDDVDDTTTDDTNSLMIQSLLTIVKALIVWIQLMLKIQLLLIVV